MLGYDPEFLRLAALCLFSTIFVQPLYKDINHHALTEQPHTNSPIVLTLYKSCTNRYQRTSCINFVQSLYKLLSAIGAVRQR